MCRMAAYLGESETTLSSLVFGRDHSLLEQSYAPREMLSGVVNADGFGAGWYAPWSGEEPAVYHTDRPLWADRNFAGFASKVRSQTIFAALRSATPGLPVEESGVPPFVSGPYMFMHNGAIPDFRHTAMRPLRDTLSNEAYSGLLGTTDSETIFAVLLDALRKNGGDLADALRETIHRVREVCEKLGVKAGLNLAATDGERMAFTRCALREPSNSLYCVEKGTGFPGAVVVASERLDGDGKWKAVQDEHLLLMDRDEGVESRPL